MLRVFQCALADAIVHAVWLAWPGLQVSSFDGYYLGAGCAVAAPAILD